MRFSLWPNSAYDTSEVLDLARWADSHGWYGVWIADHYMPNTGSTDVVSGDMHECWALLAAIAAITTDVRLGSLVAPTSVHHPAILANRSATIDHLSGGRVVLGVGAGWQINEHHAYGIELEPAGRRVTRFEEAIQIVRSLHTEARTTFHGTIFDITDAPADPKPVQSRLPILVGTSSPRMLRITARYADEWNTWAAPAHAAERRSAFEAAADSVGRDPASMHTSVQALLELTDGPTDDADLRRPVITGSAGKLADALARYREMGFDEFILPGFNLGDTRSERAERLDRLDREVIAQLR